MSRRKFTIQEVAETLKQEGCEFIGPEYASALTPFPYRCSCGNISRITFARFKNGGRCRQCGTGQFSYEYVKNHFKEYGCELLESDFNSVRQSLRYKCKCGNLTQTNFWNFRKSPQCRTCGGKEKLVPYEEVKKVFEKAGCQLLAENYYSCNQPLEYLCACGSQWATSLSNFRKGQRCGTCRIDKVSGPNNYLWQDDRESLRQKRAFSQRVRGMVKSMLERYAGERKDVKTEEILGYSIATLKDHIESHSNWLLVKDLEWHIDHIFPIKAFLDHDIWDTRLINHLDNLQPLLGTDNMSKSGHYNKDDFLVWLKAHTTINAACIL